MQRLSPTLATVRVRLRIVAMTAVVPENSVSMDVSGTGGAQIRICFH